MDRQRRIREEAADLIRGAFNDLPSSEVYVDEFDECYVRSSYMGTVFNIMPSGKYYMPWACSNLESCETCGGTGMVDGAECLACGGIGSEEAHLDELMTQFLDEEAEKLGCVVGAGEGDPCDLFLYEFTRIEEDEREQQRALQDDSISYGQLAM